MKKMLSLAAMFAVLASASPASAAINFSGDAQVRPRYQSIDSDIMGDDDEMIYYYRLRLHAAADLGDGYFAKAMISSETPGWLAAVGESNTEQFTLGVSQLYFGRHMEDSHYVMGRLPLGSLNNPIFDVAVFPFQATEIPTFLFMNDRVYGFNYGTKVGNGELNATAVVLDNDTTSDPVVNGDGVFDDGYALLVQYKTNIGKVTFEPQVLVALSDIDIMGGAYIDGPWWPTNYHDIQPLTLGANLSVPAGDTKLTFSGFYTFVDADNGVKYDAYTLRLKAVNGPVTAWVDYNAANDESYGWDDEYSNLFVWAQYNWKIHESSMGSFTLSPTVRYLSTEFNDNDASRLRTELWATVKF